MTVGEQIRMARSRLGWTATQAAEKAGIAREIWSRIECGTTKQPRAETLGKIERALGLHLETPQTPQESQQSYVMRLWEALSTHDREEMLEELVRRAVPDRSFGDVHEAALVEVG